MDRSLHKDEAFLKKEIYYISMEKDLLVYFEVYFNQQNAKNPLATALHLLTHIIVSIYILLQMNKPYYLVNIPITLFFIQHSSFARKVLSRIDCSNITLDALRYIKTLLAVVTCVRQRRTKPLVLTLQFIKSEK